MMTETVARHLRQVVAELVPGFGGLQASDFVRQIAFRVLNVRSGRQFAALNLPIKPADRIRLDSLLNECAETLRLAATEARCVRHAALVLADDLGLGVSPGQISEKIATRVGRWVLANSVPIPDSIVADYAAEVLPAIEKPLSAEEFVRTQSAAYADRWRTHGRDAWRASPPSALRLGTDRRPPLAGPSPVPASLQGSDRPVHDRYRAYFKDSARSTAERCQHPRCQPEPPAGNLPARTIRQVCGGLGLTHVQHRLLLRGLGIGLGDAPAKSAGNWADYGQEDSDLSATMVEEDLVLRVSGHLQAILAGPRGFRMRERYGDLATHGDLIEQAAMLKAYREVCRWEREHDQPMGRCGAAAVCAAAIGALPHVFDELYAHHRPVQSGTDQTAPNVDSTTFTERRHRTMDLLLSRLDIVLAHQQGRSDWSALYDRWAAQQGATSLLTAAEFDAQMVEVR